VGERSGGDRAPHPRRAGRPTLIARPPQPAATRRVYAGTLAALCATLGAERPAADLTEFNRPTSRLREIATVLDLRFADGTVVRVRQQGANFDYGSSTGVPSHQIWSALTSVTCGGPDQMRRCSAVVSLNRLYATKRG
jgi:hypothetical protein